MKAVSQSNWFLSLLALLFALLLFFNANAQNNATTVSTSFQIYDEVIENVPVNLEYDHEKYFVFGYEETVTVHLTSANKVQLNLQSNKDTRTFQVVAELTENALGTSEVKLRVKGLSTAVTAVVDPKTVMVTMEKKVEKTVEVTPELPDDIELQGYQVEKIVFEPQQVTIVTGEETAKEIDRVVAPISSVEQWGETVKQTVNVKALNSQNQMLSIENPAPQVKVTVDLVMPTKEVNLSVISTGTIPTDVAYYSFNLSEKTVEIKGSKTVIEPINTIEVPIDISSIRYATKKKVKIPTNSSYIVEPQEIEVTIQPILISTQKTVTTGELDKKNSWNTTETSTTTTEKNDSKATTTTITTEEQMNETEKSTKEN